ncbi:MAG: sulfatase [Cyclobacteriaceae bacterium]
MNILYLSRSSVLNFVSVIFISSISIGNVFCQNTQDSVGKTPNVLFIAIDDLNDFIGGMGGHPDVKTPNIDRLAANGILFDNAYCQAPMCGPSRASVLSGRLPSNTGAYGFTPFEIVDSLKNCITIPGFFLNKKYHTMSVGKIHHRNGHSLNPEWSNYDSTHIGKHPHNLINPIKSKSIFWGGATNDPVDSLIDAKSANWAIDQLNSDFDKPFFLAVGFIRPHLPLIAPKEYFDLYNLDSMSMPQISNFDLLDIPRMGQAIPLFNYDYEVWESGLEKEIVQAYLASVSFVDAQIGRLLDALENSKYSDNTIIVLWSDHGFHLGEKFTWQKFTLWQEALKVPLIFAGKGIPSNTISSIPVQLVDIYPTLVALTGFERPPHLDGNDLTPLFNFPNDSTWPPALSTFGRDNFAVIASQWKLISYFDGTNEVYNLDKDPNEWVNISRDSIGLNKARQLSQYIPTKTAPNAPGTTSRRYFSSDYWNVEYRIFRRDIFLFFNFAYRYNLPYSLGDLSFYTKLAAIVFILLLQVCLYLLIRRLFIKRY